MIKYYEKNGEQVSGEVVNGQLITTMTVGGVVVSNPLITDIESDGWVEYTPIPAGSGNVQVTPADWSALVTAVNQLTGSELVYADTAPDITTAITALRNGVTFANVAKWWSLPTLLSERATIITAISDSTVDTVGDYAFRDATALTSVNFPNVTTIGAYAFQNATALTSVNFPNATTIGGNAFQNASALTSANFPNVTTMGNSEFNGCNNLQIIKIPKLLISGGVSIANSLSQLKAVFFPKCTSFSGNSFQGSNSLESYESAVTAASNFGLYAYGSGFIKLYRLHLTGQIIGSLNTTTGNLNWNPTEGFSTTMNTLVPQQEWDLDENGDPIDCSQFTTNADKALWCFKHLFMPAFQSVSNQTLTLKSTVYDVVMNDNEVSTYFSTHGWTVARVA